MLIFPVLIAGNQYVAVQDHRKKNSRPLPHIKGTLSQRKFETTHAHRTGNGTMCGAGTFVLVPLVLIRSNDVSSVLVLKRFSTSTHIIRNSHPCVDPARAAIPNRSCTT